MSRQEVARFNLAAKIANDDDLVCAPSAFRPRSSGTRCGSTFVLPSATAMWQICSPSAVWNVSYESVRRWVLKFGPLFAQELRRRRHRPTSRWHLDEMAVLIGGKQFWLWRAVDD